MKRSLKGKMILSYLAVALLTVLVVSALIRLTSGRSLMSLVVEEQTSLMRQSVEEYYTQNGTLDGFFNNYLQRTLATSHPPKQGEMPAQPPDNHSTRGVYGLVDSSYTAVIPTMGYSVGKTVPKEKIKQKIAVDVNGKTIAWILPDTSFQFKLSSEEQLFLKRTNLAIGLAALAGILAAVAMGFFLAGRLLKPIRLLTQASKSLARGSLEQQVPVTSQDELGLLTATFNQMSADLARSDQQRKRMTADITHDLSTPLQIISGYIEMLEDNSVQLTPQRIEVIKTELGHLRRLVGDLSTLTQVEGGGIVVQLQSVQPGELLNMVYYAFQPIAARQGVTLVLDAAEPIPAIQVDEGRMVQVLKNLLENALRYTQKGGKIILGARQGEEVQLWVEDSGDGIDAEDLAYVFERFYRADRARGGSSGKMGLGLAICKALVTAQGGTITAESAGKGRGTKMLLCFAPLPANVEQTAA
jgi:two-component system, OmpR family, sensor histidine kinase BaeS